MFPEFDLPAHMAAWAQGYPELITDCPSVNPHPEWPRYYSPADVTSPRLYDVIEELLTELSSIFSDAHWHVGGDEPVQSFLTSEHTTILYNLYIIAYQKMLTAITLSTTTAGVLTPM